LLNKQGRAGPAHGPAFFLACLRSTEPREIFCEHINLPHKSPYTPIDLALLWVATIVFLAFFSKSRLLPSIFWLFAAA
jgi:hypothetical protein